MNRIIRVISYEVRGFKCWLETDNIKDLKEFTQYAVDSLNINGMLVTVTLDKMVVYGDLTNYAKNCGIKKRTFEERIKHE